MTFSIKKNGRSVIFNFNYDFLSLDFYPSDPNCLTHDGYFSEENGTEHGFYICNNSGKITFYVDGPGTMKLTLKITEEIMKSYYDTIEEWRNFLDEENSKNDSDDTIEEWRNFLDEENSNDSDDSDVSSIKVEEA
jgi:hypothetical protein